MEMETQAPKHTVKRRLRIGRLLLFALIALIVLAKHGRNVPIPFGPYLAAAGALSLFWGKELTQAYLLLL